MTQNIDACIWTFRLPLSRADADIATLKEHRMLPQLPLDNNYLEIIVHPEKGPQINYADTASIAYGHFFIEVTDVQTMVQLHTLVLLVSNVPPSTLLQITPVNKYYAHKLYAKFPTLPDNSLVRTVDYTDPSNPVYTYWAKPKSKSK